jgi:hypothetical protein
VKNLSNMPFAGSNIAKTVSAAAVNYNNAYINLFCTQASFEMLKTGINGAYILAEMILNDLIGKYVKI